VNQLWSDEEMTSVGKLGENVKIKLKDIDVKDVSPEFVLCDSNNPGSKKVDLRLERSSTRRYVILKEYHLNGI